MRLSNLFDPSLPAAEHMLRRLDSLHSSINAEHLENSDGYMTATAIMFSRHTQSPEIAPQHPRTSCPADTLSSCRLLAEYKDAKEPCYLEQQGRDVGCVFWPCKSSFRRWHSLAVQLISTRKHWICWVSVTQHIYKICWHPPSSLVMLSHLMISFKT